MGRLGLAPGKRRISKQWEDICEIKKKKKSCSKHVKPLKSITLGKVKTNNLEFIFKDHHKKTV